MTAFSIGSWSFHGLFAAGRINLFGYLESIKYRYRLRHADIWNGMLASTDDDYIRAVELTLREEELTVACLNVDGADLWHDDPDLRERNHARALKYLDIARRWNVRALRLDIGVNALAMTAEQLEHCAARYREYAQIARDYGFRVGPQTHQPASQSPGNLMALRDAVGSPAFGIVLNVNRWLADKPTGDETVAPLTMHAQFDRAFVDFAGEELPDKVRLLKRHGYDGCWSLEFRGGTNEYVEIEHDLATLRRAVRQAERR